MRSNWGDFGRSSCGNQKLNQDGTAAPARLTDAPLLPHKNSMNHTPRIPACNTCCGIIITS